MKNSICHTTKTLGLQNKMLPKNVLTFLNVNRELVPGLGKKGKTW